MKLLIVAAIAFLLGTAEAVRMNVQGIKNLGNGTV
jgi:hypothetical protein